MPAEENMALVRRLYDAQTKGDLHAMRELLTPNFDNHGMAPGQDEPGCEGYIRSIAVVHGAFSDIRYIIEEQMAAEGDKVVALGNYQWRVKANGREFGGDFAHVWTIRDGKATEFQEYMDTAVGVSAHQKAMSA